MTATNPSDLERDWQLHERWLHAHYNLTSPETLREAFAAGWCARDAHQCHCAPPPDPFEQWFDKYRRFRSGLTDMDKLRLRDAWCAAREGRE